MVGAGGKTQLLLALEQGFKKLARGEGSVGLRGGKKKSNWKRGSVGKMLAAL